MTAVATSVAEMAGFSPVACMEYLEHLLQVQRQTCGPGEVLDFLLALQQDCRRQLSAQSENVRYALAEFRPGARGRRVIKKPLAQ